jgi:hypothetical protein
LAGVLGHSPNGFASFGCVEGKFLLGDLLGDLTGDLGGSITPFIHDFWFSLSAFAAASAGFLGELVFAMVSLLVGTYWKLLNFDFELAEMYGFCFVAMMDVCSYKHYYL